jgi:hypothetical protein
MDSLRTPKQKHTKKPKKNFSSKNKSNITVHFSSIKEVPIAQSGVTTSQDKTRQPSPFTLGSSLYCKAVPWHAQDKVEIRSQLEEENGQALLQNHSNASRQEEGNQLNCE